MMTISIGFGGKAAVALSLLMASASANAVIFDFEFLDADGVMAGSGYYEFDDIDPSNKASFASLTGFSWEFNIAGFGLFLSSANGDVPSTDSLVSEGIQLSGAVGSRTLTFFDDGALNILHQDISRSFPTGIQFNDANLSQAEYFDENGLIESGTFTATERGIAVPAPAGSLFLLGGIAFLAAGRRPKS
ncbi:VPLPA-CTERM sorting domain-containing protein [Pacificimonas sp. WHA3]|uniref:VPLPA-CTERM sorting domain-containing protein n=1 Tax=Pacificimonas pallii TaxID=2827236 RepID=A0ABS6SF24_9SPHN|nr:VPLPA-CTERM sorting domain-containing protein [Pacificimonas pallii]MBV7256541.1 VPLPA-CTERM sorting domain-containing protein [Pacificimonas pallii]